MKNDFSKNLTIEFEFGAINLPIFAGCMILTRSVNGIHYNDAMILTLSVIQTIPLHSNFWLDGELFRGQLETNC